MKTKSLYSKLMLMLLSLPISSTGLTQTSIVSHTSMNMGYGETSSENTLVKSVIGQVFVGTLTASGMRVETGFLPVLQADGVITKIEDAATNNVPISYKLQQNYPNPFNPSTKISFSLPRKGVIRLIVYDVLGRQVRILTDRVFAPGYHTVEWDGTDDVGETVSSGVYYYRATVGNEVITKKMLILR